MRIIFLTSAFSYGGAQMSSVELASRLKPYHEIKFLDAYGCAEPYITALIDNNIDYSLLSTSSSNFIISKYRNRLINIFRFFLFFFEWYRIRKRCQIEIVRYQADVIIVYDDRSLSYLMKFKNKQFRTFFYARGWYTPDQVSFKTRFLLKKLVDGLICISEATRHAIFCGGIASLDKIFVVHNSVNEYKLVSNTESIKGFENCFKIVHSGGFLPSKGHHVSLQAAKLLKGRNIDFHLYLCGLIYPGLGDKSKKYYEELVDFVKSNDLGNFVSFIVGKNDIIPYIKASDVMFFPSSSEGLPRSVLEAMTLGKPVIANAVGGVTDLIIDRFTGFLTNYDAPSDYAKYAQMLMENPSLYFEISSNARNLIRTSFDEDLQIDKMNSLLMNKLKV